MRWLDSITSAMDMNLSKFWETEKDRGAWHNGVRGAAKNWTERLPTPVFWTGEFHGQRSPAGYSPWGCQELDMTEPLTHMEVLQFPQGFTADNIDFKPKSS